MKTIGIISPIKSPGIRRTLDAIGEVLGIRFEERIYGDGAGIDAWILQETDPKVLLAIAHCDVPRYTIVDDSQLIPCGESSTIEFTPHHALPCVMRGRQVNGDEATGFKALPQWLQNVTPLALKVGVPVWAIQEASGHYNHFVSQPIPELNDGEPLFQYFFGRQFLSLLPLLVFLKSLSEDRDWEPPPLQACFMFDDPNLHWPTYGFIDFSKMKRHAQLHNYHVSFATIPLDAWFVHSPTALIFQSCEQLSLLIHGNDHVSRELARGYPDEEQNWMLRQALLRIAKLERRSGVTVSRVMAPPHGACSESVLGEMARLGFEAACISRWSIGSYNSKANWLCTYGMRPADIVAGMTIIPRFRMSPNCHNSILVAALLHQPIIPMGHHHDIAEGMQLLSDLSGFVNSLGNVQWANMKRISRYHYARKHEGRILHLRLFTKHIEIFVPEGINQIFVERPWLEREEYETLVWRTLGETSEWKLLRPDESIHVQPGKIIEIVSTFPTTYLREKGVISNLHFWPIVRRQITEAKDRIAPLIKRVSGISKLPTKT